MNRPTSEAYDVAVLGGGAAGLSGALVLARARRRVAVVDAGRPRNAAAAHMHGFLSRDGQPPGEFLARGRDEVLGYGADLIEGTIETVRPGFRVELADGRTLTARRLLVATGVRDHLPAIAGLQERWARDVLHCPYCHGYEVRDEALGVLATEERSVKQALYLRDWSDDVVLFEHTYRLSDDERARLTARGVKILPGAVTKLIVHDDRLQGVMTTGERAAVARTALFITQTFTPATEPVAGLGCAMDGNGCLLVDATGAASVPGVWAAGNVVAPPAQVLTAAGAATQAAIALHQDLVREDVEHALAATPAP
jgi:thioredoxin reductase